MHEVATTRRDFLKTTGGLIVTFALADSILPAGAQKTVPTKPVALDDVDAFLAIGADGRVTLYTGKVDLGTGIRTALAQIAAEELDLPFDRVTTTQGDTSLTPDQGQRMEPPRCRCSPRCSAASRQCRQQRSSSA